MNVNKALIRGQRGSLLLAICVGWFWGGAGAFAVEPEVSLIDGRVVRSSWRTADPQRLILEPTEGAKPNEHEWRMVSSVVFPSGSAQPATGSVAIFLSDGGHLHGEITGGADERIVATTSLGRIDLPFSTLAGLRFGKEAEFEKAASVFKDSLASRPPGSDVLISRESGDVKAVRGTLLELDGEKGQFKFADRERSFQVEKIFGIVFAAGAAQAEGKPMTITLTNGDVLPGSVQQSDVANLGVRTAFGDVTLPIERLKRIDVQSDRVVYLSDLPIKEEKVDGLVHDPWPVRRDRSASNTPLSINGRFFSKGLGVHARAELTYELGAAYEKFLASVGIDDHVRPRGSVVFQVLGDGKVLFDSGLTSGAETAKEVNVSVVGIKLLTLVVDYGEGLDVSDQADWGGARLLKAQSPRTKK